MNKINLSKPFSKSYRIKENSAEELDWLGRVQHSVPLDESTTVRTENRFMGYGNLIIKRQNDEQVWENIFGIFQAKKEIERIKREYGKEEKQKETPNYPSDILFDEKVVSIPPLPDIFYRPLWIGIGCIGGKCPEWKVRTGDWINAGDTLCTFTLRATNFFGKDYDINIKSPVNGLILKQGSFLNNKAIVNKSSYSEYRNKENIYVIPDTIIAVPKGENVPSTTRETLREFKGGLITHKKRIFFEDEEFQDSRRFTKEEIDEAIEYMNNAPLLRFPMSMYKEYFGNVPAELKYALKEFE